MKKILFVISTLNTGGAQRAFSNIIMALPKDYDVNILLNDTEKMVYPYRGKIIDLGIRPEKNKTKISYQIKVLIKRYFALKKLKKEGNYTACISALESANFVNVLTGRKYCKTVLSIRIYHEKQLGNPFIVRLVMCMMKIFYNRADQIVAVTDVIRENLIMDYNLDADKVCTIYNGYNVEKIIRDSREQIDKGIVLDLSGKIIVASGRLTAQKGFEHLINCFSNITHLFPEVKLVILGEGELRSKLEQKARDFGIEDKVFLPGYVENPFAIISKCDIFVLPSLSEGYPNVLAEAIICGIPCIATDCRTGPREILSSGGKKQELDTFEVAEYGILCPSILDDENLAEQVMTQALSELLSNDNLYQFYRKQCEKRKDEFDMKNLIGQWIDVIECKDAL